MPKYHFLSLQNVDIPTLDSSLALGCGRLIANKETKKIKPLGAFKRQCFP